MKPIYKKIITAVIIALAFIAAGFYINSRMKYVPPIVNLTSVQNGNVPQVGLKNYGAAPDFTGISKWLNSPPLTMAGLRGKVVLVDFWTYSCINCIRTLPYVTKWYDTYKDSGFVVVGVHTPEFAFEKDASNVEDAIKKFNIHYPVAQDNDYATWMAYHNEYWPAEYLIDKNGNIVHTHFGEGEYDVTENAIRLLLGMKAEMNTEAQKIPTGELGLIGSPEMYFGTNRLANLSPEQNPSITPQNYSLPKDIALNEFAIGGNWQFSQENIKLVSGLNNIGNIGKIRLKFHSAKLYIVASSPQPALIKIIVDGKIQSPITITDSKLYTLFNSNDYSDHLIEITIDQPGFEAFTFTFG